MVAHSPMVAQRSRIPRVLAQLFSPAVIRDLARNGRSRVFSAVLAESLPNSSGSYTYLDFFRWAYEILRSHHRTEYVYKNAIVSKIVLGRHSLRSTSYVTEFRVEDRKADIAIFNGTSTCYEIKSDIDNLERLPHQLKSYCRVFDKTFVVTSESNLEHVLHIAPTEVGILVLTKRYTLRKVRDAKSLRDQVDPFSIFDSLRQKEYTEILAEHYGSVPRVPNTRIYAECRKLFGALPPHIAHDGMVKQLKQRTIEPEVASLAKNTSDVLAAAVLSSSLRGAEAQALAKLLASTINH